MSSTVFGNPLRLKDKIPPLLKSLGLKWEGLFFPDSLIQIRLSRLNLHQGFPQGCYSLTSIAHLKSLVDGKQKKQQQTIVAHLLAARLGEGGEADVFGPLTPAMTHSIMESMPVKIGLSTEQSDQYIVKIQKKPGDYPAENIKFFQRLNEVTCYGSILLPLIVGQVPGSWFEQNPFLDCQPKADRDATYSIEIQMYGGISSESFLEIENSLTFEDVISVWLSIEKIFLDAWTIIHNLGFYMTDIKAANMVWDTVQKRLRLIDVHFYPLPKEGEIQCHSRMMTSRVDIMPVQFLEKPWTTQEHSSRLAATSDRHSKNIRHYFKKLEGIFAGRQKDSISRKETETQRIQRHALLFVLYPILLWFFILLDTKNKVILHKSEETELVQKIKDFCIHILETRCRSLCPEELSRFSRDLFSSK
jgi:hypothetical protein